MKRSGQTLSIHPSCSGGGEATEAKKADIMSAFTVRREVCHDLADHAGEFVTMSAEARCEAYLRHLRVAVEDEMPIR